MPRAAFDNTCDLWTGPLGTPPNSLYAVGVPCRLVPYTTFPSTQIPINDRVAYLTIGSPGPNQATTSNLGVDGIVLTTYDSSDRVSVPSGAAPSYYVLWVEELAYLDEAPYFRAHLAPLPTPS
jgi:hypothetical protein